ncbi:MAG TPA: FtsX-like permease family protein, partial [Acidimicrobiales bacterium]|nr:FtsX-like permease family protein [Acidimicrobiales bacterium]
PDMVETVVASDLPPSFRVVPREPELVETIGEKFTSRPGVREVVYAKDTVDTIIRVTTLVQRAIFAVAAVLLLSAALLILNTIRMAIFARRREVAVMKLVGATNSFIRVPFMLEGMVQGLAGAATAFAVLAVSRGLIENAVEGNTLVEQFAVTSSDVLGTGLFILFIGAVVGAVGSAVAVSRFLDV